MPPYYIQYLVASTKYPRSKNNVEVCHLMNCPKLERYKAALVDTIDVLEHTKNAFKSKELGELRKKLETLIHEGSTA